MPRPPRLHVAGAPYHTIVRGDGGQRTFVDEKDYQAFVDGLAEIKMGHRPSAVAEFLRCSPPAISKIIARSLQKRLCAGPMGTHLSRLSRLTRLLRLLTVGYWRSLACRG
jgi:hypothetical protein